MAYSVYGYLFILLNLFQSKEFVCEDTDNSIENLYRTRQYDTVLQEDYVGDLHWEKFKREFNKSYASTIHENKARAVWYENLAAIKHHNSLNHTFQLRENHFSDMTLRQYLRTIVKLVKSEEHTHNETLPEHLRKHDIIIPPEIDWRNSGFKPDIPSQRRCGACYAFTIAHAVQAQLLIAKGVWEPLSEQQIVDCSGHWGNYGCGGGSLRGALRYLEAYGAMSYKDYPYEAKKSKCRWDKRRVRAKVTSWGLSPRGDEAALERAVALLGPIGVSINAAPRTFQLYHSGVYDDHTCSNKSVNHAVLIVGYSRTYWILLNWWGKHWGEKGYMKLKKGHNRCGIANYAAYVVMDDKKI
ncbi:cathepsin L4 [Arctopsyche grandis]|uniref:cathepsin L4 n=1 Tax=Arctopsyche grandis TaxID=121162 RepID=UPI00406D64BB